MDNEPPQDKTSYSGRFLDSHSFARNDMSGGGFVLSTRVVIATFPERHTGRSLRFRWEVLPLRLLFLQCGAWYRASSTAYGGSPSPKGKVLAFYLCAGCSCNAERGTAPHPPPMAVPLPRRGNVINLSTPLSNSPEIIRIFHRFVLLLPLFRTISTVGQHSFFEAESHFYVQALSP